MYIGALFEAARSFMGITLNADTAMLKKVYFDTEAAATKRFSDDAFSLNTSKAERSTKYQRSVCHTK